MTNEQAKQEAIKKAYGDRWDIIKDDVRLDGSVRLFEDEDDACFWLIKIGYNPQEYEMVFSSIEPDRMVLKSLKDLNNNNSWIRIEPDGSNLPPNGRYKILTDDGTLNEFPIDRDNPICMINWTGGGITHYKPIEKELLPIY